MNIEKFLRASFHKEQLWWLFLSVWWNFFLIKTHNVVWFLLRRFVDLVKVFSLHVTNRNHFNTLLLINLQKKKTPPKWNIAVKAICPDTRILISLTGFCALLKVYFNDVQINMCLDLSKSLWEIPLHCDLLRKRID